MYIHLLHTMYGNSGCFLELIHVAMYGAASSIPTFDYFPPAVGTGYRVLPGSERCSGCWLSQARDYWGMPWVQGLKYSGLHPPWDSRPNHPSSWRGLTVASMHCDQWVARSGPGPAFHRDMWFIDCSYACRWTIHITITFVCFLFSLRSCEMLR